MKNIQTITIDINKRPFQSLTANAGEIASRFIRINIIDNGLAVDLTGVSLYLYAKKTDGTKVFNTITVEDALKGTVLAELTSQVLAVSGIVKLTLLLVKEGSKLCSKQFLVSVDSCIVDDEAIESTNEFTGLIDALGRVNNIDSRFGEVNSQLADFVNDTDNKLELKRDKSIKITSSDLNSSSDANKIKLLNLSDEVRQAMAGTTPINATPAPNSIVTEYYVDGSITPQKMRIQQGHIMDDKHLMNIDIINKTLTTTGLILVQCDGKYYTMATPQSIALSSMGYFSVYMSKTTKLLIVHYDINTLPEDNSLIYLFSYWDTFRTSVVPFQRIKINGNKAIIQTSVDETMFSIGSQQKFAQQGLVLDAKLEDAEGTDTLLVDLKTNGTTFHTQNTTTEYIGAWTDEFDFAQSFNKVLIPYVPSSSSDARRQAAYIKVLIYDALTKEVIKEFSKPVKGIQAPIDITFYSNRGIVSSSGRVGVLVTAYSAIGEVVALGTYNASTEIPTTLNRKGYYLHSGDSTNNLFRTLSPQSILKTLTAADGYTTGVKLYNTTKKHGHKVTIDNNLIDKDYILKEYNDFKTIDKIDSLITMQTNYTLTAGVEKLKLGLNANIETYVDSGNGIIDGGSLGFSKMGNRYNPTNITFDSIAVPVTFYSAVTEPSYIGIVVKMGTNNSETFEFPICKQDNGLTKYFPLGKTFDLSQGGDVYIYFLNKIKTSYVFLRKASIPTNYYTPEGTAAFQTLLYSGDTINKLVHSTIATSPAAYGYAITLLSSSGYTKDVKYLYKNEGAAVDLNNPTDMELNIPEVVYMTKGEIFSIYYNNVIKNSQKYRRGHFYIRGQVKNGEAYETIKQTSSTDYKWEYVTSTPGTFDIEFRLYETYTGNVVATKIVKFYVKDPVLAVNKSPKIVTLGDSFTDGYGVAKYLYTFLENRGFTPVSIGLNYSDYKTYKDDAWSGYGYNWYTTTEFGYLRSDRPLNDPDNVWDAGWGYNEPNGWTDGVGFYDLTEVQRSHGKTRNQFFNPTTQKFDFSYYMNKYHNNTKIDYVISFAGLNDIIWNPVSTLLGSINTYIARVRLIVESIHLYDPTIKVLLNTVTPQPVGDAFTSAQYGIDFKHYERCKLCQEIWNSRVLSEFDTPEMKNANTWVMPVAAHFDSRYGLKTTKISACKFDLSIEEVITIDIHPNEIGAKYMADTATNYVIGLG